MSKQSLDRFLAKHFPSCRHANGRLNQAALGRRLGVTRQRVSIFLTTGRIPGPLLYAIVEKSETELTFDDAKPYVRRKV